MNLQALYKSTRIYFTVHWRRSGLCKVLTGTYRPDQQDHFHCTTSFPPGIAAACKSATKSLHMSILHVQVHVHCRFFTRVCLILNSSVLTILFFPANSKMLFRDTSQSTQRQRCPSTIYPLDTCCTYESSRGKR